MTTSQVKIFAQSGTPRLNYIAGIILDDILGLTWEIVTDRRKIGKNPVINYSNGTIKGSYKITPDPLLLESGIIRKEITVSMWNDLPVFFQTSDGADLPFDIFAASFYMVSRYEEYLEYEPDEHGRFRASSSLAFRNGFLALPVVDLWTRAFARSFLKKYPTLAFKHNEFRALLTIDSDQPFAYLGKSILISMGGLIRNMTSKKGHATDRFKIVNHEMKDPYDVYDYIIGNIEKHNADSRFFFPAGDHSKHDKNPSWKSEEYRTLIKRIAGKFDYGLHPSYSAANRFDLLENEMIRLKSITGKEITLSRYHFIRLFTPASFSNLIKLGITEDYSMGFPDEPGFRAGIARPYFFYNVSEDLQTNLKVVPFQVMDATLFQYKNLGPEAAEEVIFRIMDQVKRVGGLFVSLWHNTSVLETEEWKGWRYLFEKMLQRQKT